jgi:hypothetical protein
MKKNAFAEHRHCTKATGIDDMVIGKTGSLFTAKRDKSY